MLKIKHHDISVLIYSVNMLVGSRVIANLQSKYNLFFTPVRFLALNPTGSEPSIVLLRTIRRHRRSTLPSLL